MKLHFTRGYDWERIPDKRRSALQQLASWSNGILTLPNLISLLGGLAVLLGIMMLWQRNDDDGVLLPSVLIIAGRLLDIADGYVADWTKTKSPVGEAVDATIDKIVLFVAAAALVGMNLIPYVVGISMLIHSFYVAGISLFAQLRGKVERLHPSRHGKMAVWFEWCAIGFFLFTQIESITGGVHLTLTLLAWLCFLIFIALGIYSALSYTKTLIRQSPKKLD